MKKLKLTEARTPSLREMPFVLVIKRKSVRQFPDGTMVGLYYSDRLNRFISIPFLRNAEDKAIPMASEEVIIAETEEDADG